MKSPFFIVGVPRSGTTLLSVILNNHSEVFIDKDAVGISMVKIIQQLKREFAFYPDQSKEKLFQRLINESYKQRLKNLLDWENLGNFEDLQTFFLHSISQKLTVEGKQIWGDKTPELSQHIPEIKSIFPSAKIIHIIRNPFANCLSLHKRQYMNLKLAAQHWKDLNAIGLAQQYIYGANEYLLIKYEQLIKQPEKTVQVVCDFLQIPFEQEMIQLSKARETQLENAYVESRFNTQKLNQWKNELTTKELQFISSITGDLTQKLDYNLPEHIEIRQFQSLSFGKRMRLQTLDIFKMLFKRRRINMTGRKLVTVEVPFKQRISIALGKLITLFGSEEVYHAFLKLSRKAFKKPE